MIRITLKAQSDWLAKRKAELGLTGIDYLPVNPGGRRSSEKRALLRKLRSLAADNPRALRFKGNP
jgi:hypothetical protein